MDNWLQERRKDDLKVFCPYEKGKVIYGLAMVGAHSGKLIGEYWIDKSDKVHIETFKQIRENIMKQSIVEFFDPYNIEHLKAYRHLEKTGFWPEGFVSDEMMKNCPMLWQAELVAKLARAWLQAAEDEHIAKLAKAWLQAAEDGHIFGMPHFDQ